jgi:catechol 2,3-dioxygenase-like lactoylglutathione lyase family enzyme
MTFHVGRLIDHVHLRARDFPAMKRFYEAVLAVLEIPVSAAGEGWLQVDELYIDEVDENAAPSSVHLAFQARDHQMVQEFHRVALAAGGRDNGGPGERHYHAGYYAAFVFDPDGNNIEAVYHGPNRRSAASVEIEAGQ